MSEAYSGIQTVSGGLAPITNRPKAERYCVLSVFFIEYIFTPQRNLQDRTTNGHIAQSKTGIYNIVSLNLACEVLVLVSVGHEVIFVAPIYMQGELSQARCITDQSRSRLAVLSGAYGKSF